MLLHIAGSAYAQDNNDNVTEEWICSYTSRWVTSTGKNSALADWRIKGHYISDWWYDSSGHGAIDPYHGLSWEISINNEYVIIADQNNAIQVTPSPIDVSTFIIVKRTGEINIFTWRTTYADTKPGIIDEEHGTCKRNSK
jgi:hypothetical protein